MFSQDNLLDQSLNNTILKLKMINIHKSTLPSSIYSNHNDGSKQIVSLAVNIQSEHHKR